MGDKGRKVAGSCQCLRVTLVDLSHPKTVGMQSRRR